MVLDSGFCMSGFLATWMSESLGKRGKGSALSYTSGLASIFSGENTCVWEGKMGCSFH